MGKIEVINHPLIQHKLSILLLYLLGSVLFHF